MNIERNTLAGAMWLFSRMGIEVGSIIDAGAAEAGFFLMLQQMRVFPKARYLFLDCLEENAEIYRKLAQAFSHKYEICAVAAETGTLDVRVTEDMYGSGIYAPEKMNKPQQLRTVKARRLDDIMASADLPKPYFLKLDLQGAEVPALHGAQECLKSCVGVVAEARPHLFNGDKLNGLRDLLAVMENSGFITWDIVDTAYKENATMMMYQCDVLFIHESVFPKAAAAVADAEKYAEATQKHLQQRFAKIAEINALIAQSKNALIAQSKMGASS